MWNAETVERLFGGSEDFVKRTVNVGKTCVQVLFLDGLTSGAELAEFVMRPLQECVQPGSQEHVFRQLISGCIFCASMTEAETAEQTADRLARGDCALLVPGKDRAVCFEVKSGNRRGPESPESENTVKGAKDAFTETLRTNTSLIRRHLRTPKLRLEGQTVGLRSKTAVTVCYLEGVSDPAWVSSMKKRIASLQVESLLSPAAVEEAVTGGRHTAFPLIQYTERTDAFCQGLSDGQIGLLVDGLPIGYLSPVSFGKLMTSPEDRAVDIITATCLRVLRYTALLGALLLPAVYAAMAMHHQQMLPTKLLLAIIESKQQVPFPTIVEVLGLLASFELLQEAGLHLPQAIGTSVSIIGGLVVGTAAVDARIVSPAALIVTAFGGICSYTLPNRDLADGIRVWRFAIVALGGIGGLFGVTMGFLALLVHLGKLTSLQSAYLEPFSGAQPVRAFRRPGEHSCRKKE